MLAVSSAIHKPAKVHNADVADQCKPKKLHDKACLGSIHRLLTAGGGVSSTLTTIKRLATHREVIESKLLRLHLAFPRK